MSNFWRYLLMALLTAGALALPSAATAQYYGYGGYYDYGYGYDTYDYGYDYGYDTYGYGYGYGAFPYYGSYYTTGYNWW